MRARRRKRNTTRVIASLIKDGWRPIAKQRENDIALHIVVWREAQSQSKWKTSNQSAADVNHPHQHLRLLENCKFLQAILIAKQ
jgi:hypothetical protein